MTLADYLDPAAFPLTTQPGLSPYQQFLVDSTNYDDLIAHRAAGEPIDHPADQARAAELDAKHAGREEAMAELTAGAK